MSPTGLHRRRTEVEIGNRRSTVQTAFYALCAYTVPITMDVIAAEFGEGKSLYDVLDIPRSASQEVIKKAYFKLALKCVSL